MQHDRIRIMTCSRCDPSKLIDSITLNGYCTIFLSSLLLDIISKHVLYDVAAASLMENRWSNKAAPSGRALVVLNNARR